MGELQRHTKQKKNSYKRISTTWFHLCKVFIAIKFMEIKNSSAGEMV